MTVSRIYWKKLTVSKLLCVLLPVAIIGMVSMVSEHKRDVRKWGFLFPSGNTINTSIQPLADRAIHTSGRPINGEEKPHFVLGILSTNNRQLRDASRHTWISTMLSMENELPFRMTYKYLLDVPTNETIEENSIHQDIVFLNITHHGYAFKFGEKLYVWLQYIHTHYPDALLSAKLDDDVYLCVPQLMRRIDSLKSATLYYGWAHGHGNKIMQSRRVDEMFVVVGREIVERIVNRTFCGAKTCKSKDELIDTDYADTSLAEWISIYNDIDFHPDNTRITHFGRGAYAKHAYLVTEQYCKERLIFHKSSAEVMQQLHAFTKLSRCSDVSSIVGAVTGNIFSGNISRKLLPLVFPPQVAYLAAKTNKMTCDHWAVVTTIFAPTKAISEIAKVDGWCLLIVADSKTPPKDDYLKTITNIRLKYLTVAEQNRLYPFLAQTIPLNHFGRKNIGYMYAIHHKAKRIWDFDDDNIGIINTNDTLFRTSKFPYVTACEEFTANALNPYPYFGTAETHTWPRGFPLQLIKNKSTIPNTCNTDEQVNIGVIQSLANEQPDVDAIYRLTREVPFNFKATRQTHRPFVVPKDVYSPFNAQATLWYPAAFHWLPLPVSVNGRVSDIWRSYIAQHFMFKSDVRLAFSSPYVVQNRNAHTIIKDFNGELDLYLKSKQLIEFLSSTTPTNIVDLYKELYMRNYLEESDIWFIEAWQKTLQHINDRI